MSFSERYGHKPVRQALQIDSMDAALRNTLWSLLTMFVWDQVQSLSQYDAFEENPEIEQFCLAIWVDYFEKPVDDMPRRWRDAHKYLRHYFFDCEWNEVYDFLEFVVERYPYGNKHNFVATCNLYLEKECSAYRLTDGLFVRITDETEVAEVQKALDEAQGPIHTHLRRSLELLSDRQNPDYRNSIKESISAVESLVSITLGEKGTLGQLIKKLETEIGLHPAMKSAFSSLYGYTSDASGVRHAIMDPPKNSFEEAKFFLVVCSAFVNFVTARLAAIQP